MPSLLFWVRIRGAVGLSHSLKREYPKSGVGQTDSADKAKHAFRSIKRQCQRQMVIYGY
jgi:hypothetical protein